VIIKEESVEDVLSNQGKKAELPLIQEEVKPEEYATAKFGGGEDSTPRTPIKS